MPTSSTGAPPAGCTRVGSGHRWLPGQPRSPVSTSTILASYPLYITHSLIGFVLLKMLIHAGMAFPLAVGIVLAIVIALSWALHLAVEVPSNRLGKRLAAA